MIQDDATKLFARADITEAQPPGAIEDLMARIWGQHPGCDAFLLAYTERPDAGWELPHRCAAALPREAGHETMVVTGDTWELSDGSRGTVADSDQVAAAAASAGLHRAEHRGDLEALFDCAAVSDELNDQIRDAVEALPPAGDTTAIIARIGSLLRHHLPDKEPSLHEALTQFPGHLSVADAHQLAILAQSPDATDFAVLSITQENARAHLQLWRSVVNHAPAYTSEVPLYIAGMAAWAGGDGPVATIALRRSQEVASAMAAYDLNGAPHLLHDLIGEVVTPAAWAQMRLALLASADPRVRHEITAAAHPPAQRTGRSNTGRQQPDPGPERRRPADPGCTL